MPLPLIAFLNTAGLSAATASSFPLAGSGGGVVELPYFWRRLNAQARRRSLVRAVLVSRLQASLLAASAPAVHPDAYIQPGETE